MWLDIALGILLLITLYDGVRKHWFLSLLGLFGNLVVVFILVYWAPRLHFLASAKANLGRTTVIVAEYILIPLMVMFLVGLLVRTLRRDKSFRRRQAWETAICSGALALAGALVFFIYIDLFITEVHWRDHWTKPLATSRIASFVHRAENRIVRPDFVSDHTPAAVRTTPEKP